MLHVNEEMKEWIELLKELSQQFVQRFFPELLNDLAYLL